jgi:hypothetical protein
MGAQIIGKIPYVKYVIFPLSAKMPRHNNIAMGIIGYEWDTAAFVEKLKARLTELQLPGETQKQTQDRLKITDDDLRVRSGRQVGTVLRVARSVGWTPYEALGLPSIAHYEREILKIAIGIAQDTVPRRRLGRADPEGLADASVEAYELLVAIAADGGDPTSKEAKIAAKRAIERTRS